MSFQEGISLQNAWYTKVSNTEIKWEPPANSRPTINAVLTRGQTDLYLRKVVITTDGTNASIEIDFATTQSTDDMAELSHQLELHGDIKLQASGGHEITIEFAGNDLSDPYNFTPSNSAALHTFFTSVVAETDHAAAVDLYDGDPAFEIVGATRAKYQWFPETWDRLEWNRPTDGIPLPLGFPTYDAPEGVVRNAYGLFAMNYTRAGGEAGIFASTRYTPIDSDAPRAEDITITAMVTAGGASWVSPALVSFFGGRDFGLNGPAQVSASDVAIFSDPDARLYWRDPSKGELQAYTSPSWTTDTAASQSLNTGQALSPAIQVPEVDTAYPAPDYFATALPAGLSFDHATRQITGAPSGADGNITIEARNVLGTDVYTIPYTITTANPPSPPTNVVLTAGNAQIAATCDAPTGASTYRWQYRTRPTGNWQTHTETTRSVTITGLTNNQLYQVRVQARNTAGDSSYTAAISATPAATPVVPTAIGDFFAVKGHAIEGTYKDETSGAIGRTGVNDRDSLTLPAATDVATNGAVSYGIVETLPTGLSFNTSTRVLSGTLNNSVSVSGATEERTFTYRVTRGSITVDRSFTITLGETASRPVITAIGGALTTLNLLVGTSAGLNRYSIAGAPLPTNSVVGTVPDGLVVNLLQPAPGQLGEFIITGIPTANATGFFTLRSDSSQGAARDLRINYVITGEPQAPVWNDDTGNRVNGRVGDAIDILVPAVDTGAPAPTYAEVGSVLSTLGLSFSGTTRRITGTVTAALTRTITIRASNTQGSDDWTIVLSFLPALVAPNFSPATGDRVVGDVDVAVVINIPDPGGNPTPTLTANIPAEIAGDLTFNAGNRQITGTPRVEDSDIISVTATNSQGSSTWSVSYEFTIPDAVPEWNNPTGNALTGDAGRVVIDITIPAVDTGHPDPTYAEKSGNEAPAGLTFNTETRQLAGTPSSAGSGTIIIVASNTEGSDEYSIPYNFSKPERAPSWVDNTGDDVTWQATVPITNITIPAADAATNPDPTYMEGTLPSGIRFNRTTRVISGTPAAGTAGDSGTITITAMNTVNGAAQTADYTFDYEIGAAPVVDVAPFWSETTGSTITATVGTAITDLVIPTANGTPTPTLSIDGDLPFGLEWDASTRTISGTPLVSGTFSFNVRATNREDTADWQVDVTVGDVANTFTFLMPASTFDDQSSTQVRWQTDGGSAAPRPQISADFIDGSGDRFVQRIRLRSNGQFQLSLGETATDSGGVNQDLSENFEVTGTASLSAESTTATFSMINLLDTGSNIDNTEPYEGIVSDNTELASIVALFNAVVNEADNTVPLVVTFTRTPFAAPVFPAESGVSITGTAGEAIDPDVTVPPATGIPAPTYSAGNTLPDGVSFDDSTRVISGTPSTNGQGNIVITASNTYGGTPRTDTYTIPYNISAAPIAPSWGDNDSGAAVTVLSGDAITDIQVPAVEVGSPTISYAMTGAPTGLSLTGRVISGTPTQTGSFTITITASSTGASGEDTYTIAMTVQAKRAPSWGNADTANRVTGTVGAAIPPFVVPNPTIVGRPAHQYRLKGGTTPPANLVFNESNKTLSGTPAQAGSGTIVVEAYNNQGSDEYKIPYTFAASANPPPVPQSFRGTVGDEQVTLTWEVAGDDVTGYEIEYKLSSASSWTDFLGVVDNIGSIVTGLVNGNNYDFRVRSLIGGEASQWSDTLTIAPQTNAATDFDIRYRPVGDIGMHSFINTRQQLVTITGLENDTAYTFDVRANNSTGISDWSDSLVLVPTRILGKASTFRVRYRPDNTSQPYSLEEVAVTTATVTGLRNKTPYDFAVQSRGIGGNSAYTDEITLTPDQPLNPATLFRIRYRPYQSEENYRAVTTTMNTVTILNLMNGVLYEFAVRGENDEGSSDWTPNAFFTPIAPIELGVFSGDIKVSDTAYRKEGGSFGVIDFSQKDVDGEVVQRGFNDDIRVSYNIETSEALSVYRNLKAQRSGVINTWRLNEEIEVRGFLREFRITMGNGIPNRSSLYLRVEGIPPAGG